MSYVSIGNLFKGTQVRIPWKTLTFFIDFIFSRHNIGTLDRALTSTFPLYIPAWNLLLLGRGFVGSNPYSPFLKLISPCQTRIEHDILGWNPVSLYLFLFYFASWLKVVGSILTPNFSFIFFPFSFTLLHSLEVVFFIPTPHITFILFFLNFTRCLEVVGSIPTPLSLFY